MKAKLKSLIKLICKFATAFFSRKSKMFVYTARLLLEDYSPSPLGDCCTENKLDLQYDVQIIIPVYNAERYIRECLESVLFVQDTQYSVLTTVINDGSTDRSLEIITDCVENKKKIKKGIKVEVITQENRGFSGARNRGLKTIKGKYVLFLDSDDILPANAIERMVSKASSEDADIVQGSWISFRDDISNGKINNCEGVASGYPWGKAYKYTVLQNFRFPEGFWFEDTPISFMLMARSYHFTAVSDVIYLYRYNPSGITATARKRKKVVDTFWITEECLREFTKFGLAYDQRAYEYLLRQSIMNERRIVFQPRQIREAIFILTIELIHKYFDGFKTRDITMKQVEDALQKKQFSKFELLVLGDWN